MGIDVDRGHGRDLRALSARAVSALPDIDYRAPFREPRAAIVIFLQALGELVQPCGDQLTRAVRQGLRAFVDLDAGDSAGLFDQLHQRRAVLDIMAKSL